MEIVPETRMISLSFLLRVMYFVNKNQKDRRVRQSTNIPVIATGFAGLGCPFMAFSFSKLHQ